MTEDFDDRLSRVERALRVLSSVSDNPELQSRAFDVLFGPRPSALASSTVDARVELPSTGETTGENLGQRTANSGISKSRTAGKRPSKSATVSMDKNLETQPTGAKSWRDFVAEKSPVNQHDRNTVAVYWLRELAGHDTVNANQVFTLYIDADWKPATDPRNSLQRTASTEGLIDTADMDDIKMSPRGIGRVKNDLPLPTRVTSSP